MKKIHHEGTKKNRAGGSTLSGRVRPGSDPGWRSARRSGGGKRAGSPIFDLERQKKIEPRRTRRTRSKNTKQESRDWPT
jgi:hypothetical protein